MSKARIMVVEDENIVAMDLQNKLRTMGYVVCGIASSGEEAVIKATQTRPDLILMDIRLKGEIDGIEAARRIRDDFDTPVVYLTAYSDENTLQRAKATGPSGYLLKPFKDREVHATIEMALYKHKMEMELKKSEQKFATALISIGDAVMATDPEGKVTFMNPIAEKLTGWSQQEALGKDMADVFNIISELTRESVENPVTEVLEGGVGITLPNATILINRSKAEIPIDDGAAPIKDDRGNVTGVVLVFRDISERKRAEEALRHSEEQLRQAQRMESIGKLAGGVAHDFNNMLTAITGYSQLLLGQLTEGDPLRRYAEEIDKAGKRAAALTRQLLSFSRKQMLQPKALDLNAMVADMKEMLQRIIGEDIELATVLNPALWQVKADPSQIEQVIMNLVVNARDAMPQGGRLTMETANVDLDGAYAREHISVKPGPHVMLAISDNGTGMDKETRSKIFEPFFTTKEQGTGLGLSTVYGIVKQSGGNIWVYSEVGRGTTFKIYLPRVSEPSQAVKSYLKVEPPIQGKEVVLVVEDEQAVRQFISHVLQTNGYTVLEASNGDEALMICRQYMGSIQLMITDVVMPQMSGPQLAEQLVPLRSDMRVLYISGYTDDTIVHHGVLERGVNFLQKPFTPDGLAHKVREVLDQFQK